MEQPRHSKLNRERWDLDKIRYHLDKPLAPSRKIRSLQEILKTVTDGLETPVQENITILREAWPKLVGKQIASHSEPGFIKEHALHVFVDHPGWMPELERVKRVLLQKLKSQYRELRLARIKFILTSK